MSAARGGVEVQRLLHDRLAGLEQRDLPRDLGVDARSTKRNEFMFLSSVLVPSSSLPDRAHRHVGVAAQRALLHVHVARRRAGAASRAAGQPVARLLGGVQVGLGDDLRERRAAAVEVDHAGLGAVDAARRADVHELRRVLLEVDAVDAHVAQPPAAAQRDVVLGDLVALRQVGIEVVLAVEDRPRRELAAEREARSSARSAIACALTTGSAPGRPRHTGHVRVLGGSPNDSAQPQNIFVRVVSWTWISSPMTGS